MVLPRLTLTPVTICRLPIGICSSSIPTRDIVKDESEYDEQKVGEMVLALLCLTMFKDQFCYRAWKGKNWDSMDRLHEKGYISDPASKAKSVIMTEEGVRRARELFEKHFAKAS
jgi:hypothetical protein